MNKLNVSLWPLFIFIPIVIYFFSVLLDGSELNGKTTKEVYNSKYGLIIEVKNIKTNEIINYASEINKKNIYIVFLDNDHLRYAPFKDFDDLNDFYVKMQTKFPDVKMRLDVKKDE